MRWTPPPSLAAARRKSRSSIVNATGFSDRCERVSQTGMPRLPLRRPFPLSSFTLSRNCNVAKLRGSGLQNIPLVMAINKRTPRRLFAGHRVRELRLQLGISQVAMAARLGISVSYLSQIENGDRPITPAVLTALARTFPD